MTEIPDDRKETFKKLRAVIKQNLPKGFEEKMTYGMIGYVVPPTLYPPGYHYAPGLPFGFMNIASQKNFIAVYHIRFKNPDKIRFELIGELAGKITVQEWIDLYEKNWGEDKSSADNYNTIWLHCQDKKNI